MNSAGKPASCAGAGVPSNERTRTASAADRRDFETLLLEEGDRSYWLAYTSPIERAFTEIAAVDRAFRLPVRPWVIGECCDHIYPTCPHVVRTGRLDAKDGKWWLGRYETVDDPDNTLWLHPDEDPGSDVCGWCFRVWRSRVRRELAVAS